MSRKYEKAFTTLELLIILVIIGFFVAMLAPRLSQMFDDATTKISDMNKKDSMRFSRMWTVKHGPKQIGNNLINIVNYTGTEGDETNAGGTADSGEYQFLSLAEKNFTTDGAEWLSYQFVNRMKPHLHTLSTYEVEELRDMGLTHIYMADADDGAGPAGLKRYRIRAGMRVLMVGAGQDGGDFACGGSGGDSWAAGDYVNAGVSGIEDGDVQADGVGRDEVGDGGIPDDGNADVSDGIGYETGIGYPQYMYRILMGIGEDSTLVTDGVVDNEGISPDAISQEQHYRFNRYVVVLPRLMSTVRLLTGRQDDGAGGLDDYDNGNNCPKLYVGERTDGNGDVERNQWLVADRLDKAAQPFDNFDVISPEGYKVLDETMENLKIRTDYDGPSLWETHANTIYDDTAAGMIQP